MQKQWVGKNVDLGLLSRCVEDFFEKKGFKTVKEESAGEYKISLVSRGSGDGLARGIYLRILGDPNDFVLELGIKGRADSLVKWELMATMLGAGRFLVRSLELQEVLEKLEREFWVYVEEVVTRLVGSA